MRLFLAGYEANTYNIEIFENKSLFVLGSFFYLKKCKKDYLDKYINYIKTQCKDFILDSGAFSLLNSNKNLDVFLNNLDKYIQEYINFINEYNIKHFIELDIDSLIGYERVKEIRKRIEKETNKKCIPAWHLSRGLNEWNKLTKEYNYVALGGLAIKEIKKRDYKKILHPLLRIAKKNNCKIHGLGFTSVECEKYDFYSVDSTTWSSCVRYARIYSFNTKTKEMKSKLISKTHRIDQKGDKYTKILKISLREWIKYQKFLLGGENGNNK
nr:MAG TPA: Queuine tRNA-ribosyltransferase [Caudoviricetes sp.]